MSDIDQFARQLLEEAKRFFERANSGESDDATHAFLHAALMLGFCAFEMYRLTDHIEFIFRRFFGNAIDKSQGWWVNLKAALNTRNDLIHPKQQTEVSKGAVEAALKAIIQTLGALYKAVYRRPYPPSTRGLNSTMDF